MKLREIFIYGNPHGFDLYGDYEDMYLSNFRKFYRDSTGRNLIIERLSNGDVYYNYIRYGLRENAVDRPTNGIFGMSLLFANGLYYADFKGLLSLFDKIYNMILKDSIIFSLDGDVVRYNITRFSERKSYIDVIKNYITKNIDENLIVNCKKTFSSGGEKILSDKVVNETIANAFQEYSTITLGSIMQMEKREDVEQSNIKKSESVKKQNNVLSSNSEANSNIESGISVASFNRFYTVILPVVRKGLKYCSEDELSEFYQYLNTVNESNKDVNSKYDCLKSEYEKVKTSIAEDNHNVQNVDEIKQAVENSDDSFPNLQKFIVPIIVFVLIICTMLLLKKCNSCNDEPTTETKIQTEQELQRNDNPPHDSKNNVVSVKQDNKQTLANNNVSGKSNQPKKDEQIKLSPDIQKLKESVLYDITPERGKYVIQYFSQFNDFKDNSTIIKWQIIGDLCDIINEDIEIDKKKNKIEDYLKTRSQIFNDIESEILNDKRFEESHKNIDDYASIQLFIREIIVKNKK